MTKQKTQLLEFKKTKNISADNTSLTLKGYS